MLNLRTLLAALIVVAFAALPPAFAANGSAAQLGPLKVHNTALSRCKGECPVTVARREPRPVAAPPAPAAPVTPGL